MPPTLESLWCWGVMKCVLRVKLSCGVLTERSRCQFSGKRFCGPQRIIIELGCFAAVSAEPPEKRQVKDESGKDER